MLDRVRPRRNQWFLWVPLGITVALAAGAIAVVLPELLVEALIAAIAVYVALIVARHYVAARPALAVLPDPKPPGLSGVPEERADPLAPARYLFYGGMFSLGQATIRPLFSLTASDWLFFAAFTAALAGTTASGSKLKFRIPALLVLGAALYVVFGLLSSIGATNPVLSIANVARFGYLALAWFWLGTVVLTRGAHLRTAVSLWVASIAIDGLAAVLQTKGVPIPFLGPVMGGRMTGFTGHPNDLGGAAAVALAPAFALVATSARLRARMLWIVAFLLIVAGAVLCGSVSGMAVGIGAIGVWLVVSSLGVRPFFIVLVAVTLALGLTHLQGAMGLPTPVERVLSSTGQSAGGAYSTVASRLRDDGVAWAALGDGGFLGHGVLGYMGGGGPEAAHNMLLLAWYQAGLAAAVGMLCIVLAGIGSALLAARLALTQRFRLLATSLFAAIVSFFVFSLSSPMVNQRYGWVSVALALSALVVARRGLKVQAAWDTKQEG